MQNNTLIDINDLTTQLQDAKSPIAILKQAIKDITAKQSEQFNNQQNIIHLVHERSGWFFT